MKSIEEQKSEEILSVYMNYPALLIRKKCEKYPLGRTSHKFKNFLRERVTILDKNKKTIAPKIMTDADMAEDEDNEGSEAQAVGPRAR